MYNNYYITIFNCVWSLFSGLLSNSYHIYLVVRVTNILYKYVPKIKPGVTITVGNIYIAIMFGNLRRIDCEISTTLSDGQWWLDLPNIKLLNRFL